MFNVTPTTFSGTCDVFLYSCDNSCNTYLVFMCIRETGRPFNRHKTKLNAISSQDAPLAADPRGRRWVTEGEGLKPPSNCAITRRARTTRQSQLLLTDIRLMIVCAARKRPNVSWNASWRTRLWSLRHCDVRVIFLQCAVRFVAVNVSLRGENLREDAEVGRANMVQSKRGSGRGGRVLVDWVRDDDLWRG